MRILIGAGGTGGHVYPALATAQALLADGNSQHQLFFVGAAGGMEGKLVQESGIPFAAYHEVQAGPLHGVDLFTIVSSAAKLSLGSLQAFNRVRSLRPGVALLTGGWANLPLALAARMLRIPIVIYLPDIEPGLTIRALQRFAARIATTVSESAQYFPAGKTVVTGYPLQDNRLQATREGAIKRFRLDPSRKTLLVFGGSRGARNINIALGDCLPRLLDEGLQIIHITGDFDWERSQSQVAAYGRRPQYRPFPYLHEDMGLAFAAADLAVCRAGASALAELPLFALPAILVPYPYAWRYQSVNADYLSDRGAALRLNDEDMAASLCDRIISLIRDDARLQEMRASSRALANADGARRLADLLIEVGGA
ncbi:MAG: UDP-N-acetylglucosamine--N-acetylmuramyl-(pentapeptide) pyrophosphoryl-undecaprenol N-acetylglucosamine transferase [Chloroflexota bacterium]|nr:UDP-N-acetylglucosamine--N-acetylmuramyl-(pentapeptide) pyrophosphoryl-undecaprenol N-acetylglucosamine transferase [Chloroflexota bacterium]